VLVLKTEEARGVLINLVKKSDVFIHSLRPQAMEKLGFSYIDISRENNKIIYCGMYGFSKEGPYGSNQHMMISFRLLQVQPLHKIK
jgi:crotonobetainyl-CoA:carnitine CoA-transferase CaiB-like acyl-CoA transferase